MTLSEELRWRGFVNQTTLEDPKLLDSNPLSIYLGVDPSANSMTVGNLAVIMMVKHFQRAGHTVYMLVGGATGMIGDPGGKDAERTLQPLETIAENKKAIAAQYDQVLGKDTYTLVDNYDWFKDITVLDFLRDTGKHFSVTQMLDRDFVSSRIGKGGTGISYAEFSYALIQGYDFLHLFREHGVSMQICGADQWGNAISGIDLIRKVTGKEAHVWSAPLVINKATGKKFGKSEGGAVWLDSKQTSVYDFYQFWLNVDDEGVAEYLKIYTLLSRDDIDTLAQATKNTPEAREAQKALAYEVTATVHGASAADSVQRISQVLFGNDSYQSLTGQDFDLLKQQLPSVEAKVGDAVMPHLVQSKLANSNSEARRFLQDGAVYLNGEQLGADTTLGNNHVIHGHAILRRGKNASAVLVIAS